MVLIATKGQWVNLPYTCRVMFVSDIRRKTAADNNHRMK